MARWLVFSVLAALCWGLWGFLSKLASDAMPSTTNQVVQTLGLVPVGVLVLFAREARERTNLGRGVGWGVLTGLLGGLGNVALYEAMRPSLGGKASIIVPLTAMYPLITVVGAVILLRERLNGVQRAGIVLALASMYLLT